MNITTVQVLLILLFVGLAALAALAIWLWERHRNPPEDRDGW